MTDKTETETETEENWTPSPFAKKVVLLTLAFCVSGGVSSCIITGVDDAMTKNKMKLSEQEYSQRLYEMREAHRLGVSPAPAR